MIAGLKPYPAYKDSGVEWLGEVPEHWEVRRLKTLCSQSALYGANVAATSYATTGVRFLRTTDITEDGQLKGGGVFLPKELVRDYLLADGDVLISRSGTIGRSLLYRSSSHGPCAYAGYLVRFVPASEVLPRYIFLFTKTQAFAGFLRVMAISSTIENVNGEKYANSPLSVPPLPEQTAITHFLDYTDRRIQRYIQAKQKLITFLEEQKQAIIHQAVTGRIDVRTGQPYPAYQDSGVEWLGEVPEHWGVRKLRRCVTVSGGMTPSMEVRRFWGGLIPWVTPKDMKRAVIDDSSVRVTDSAIQETPLRLVEPPAVLIVVRGMILARRVPIASTTAPVTINQDMKALRTVKGTNAAFLARLLDSAQEAFMPLIDEAGHGTRRLPMERWRELVIAIPPEEEQAAIVEHLDHTTTDIDHAISHTQRQIDLLSEYRTRLISDVVTGKLDVREAAAKLPEVDPLETEVDSEEAIETTAELAEDLNTVGLIEYEIR